jgi:hypothetical protein
MTPEQRKEYNSWQREYQRDRRAKMTPEQIKEIATRRRESDRERWALMTPEQIKEKNRRQRERYARMRARKLAEENQLSIFNLDDFIITESWSRI